MHTSRPASHTSSSRSFDTGPEGRAESLLFGGVETRSNRLDVGLLVLRAVAGLALAFSHGLGKVPPSERFVERVAGMGLPMPELFAWLSATAEFGGGLLLLLGLLTRPVAFLIIGNMAVVTFLGHAGDPFGDREAAVLYGAIAILYLLAGAGRYSLDALVRRRGR